MKIVHDIPPNYEEIKRSHLKPDEGAIFAYGDTLYVPHGRDVPPDIMYHEEVHAKQQKVYISPQIWWTKYIYDRDFRLHQEVEAYKEQYLFVKRNTNVKIARECLNELSDNLSGTMYNLGITKHQAERMIRK